MRTDNFRTITNYTVKNLKLKGQNDKFYYKYG